MKTSKFLFSVLAAAVAAISCQKESHVDQPVKMVHVRITASVGDDTKATMDGMKMSFSAGDKIGVSTQVKGADIFELTTVEGGNPAVFEGELPEGFTKGKAVYPYSAITTNSTAANFQVKVPYYSQRGVTGDCPSGQTMMYTAFDDIADGMIFHHGTALFKVEVKGNNVTEIRLSTESDDSKDAKHYGAIALPADKVQNIGCATGGTSTKNGVKYIKMTPAEGETFAPGYYYFAVLACKRSEPETPIKTIKGLKLTYTTSTGDKLVRESANEIVIDPGVIYDLKTSEQDCELLPPPTEINDAADMIAFIANVATYQESAVVKINADIDLGGAAVYTKEKFSATLDGQNHAIKNWKCESYLMHTNNGTIKNLVIDASCDVTYLPNNSMGLLAYENFGVIENCVNNADILFEPAQATGTTLHCGVFSGTNRKLIKNCVNNGNVSIEPTANVGQIRFGGIVGSNAENSGLAAEGTWPIVEGCTNNGDIVFTPTGSPVAKDKYLGGIVAVQDSKDDSKVIGCVNNGIIKCDGRDTDKFFYPGGICGLLKGGIIKDCSNFGDVIATGSVDNVTPGGLVSQVKFGKPVSGIVTSLENCVVNCSVQGTSAAGIVLGWCNSAAANGTVLGTAEKPIKVSGSVNGTELSAANYEGKLTGLVNAGLNITVNATYEVVNK